MIFRNLANVDVALAADWPGRGGRGRLAAFSALLALALAGCGGGGGGGPASGPLPAGAAPVANFAFSCADLACRFTSTSTTQVIGDVVAAQRWTFGDSTAEATTPTVDHVFTAAGDYDVSLPVSDAIGTDRQHRQALGDGHRRAGAGRAACQLRRRLRFARLHLRRHQHVRRRQLAAARLWDFGDGVTLAGDSPATHHYATTSGSPATTSTLAVTDAAGKTSTSRHSVTVAPPATTLDCVGGNCVLNLAQAVEGDGDARRAIRAPRATTRSWSPHRSASLSSPIGCSDPIGLPSSVNGGSTFPASTTLAGRRAVRASCRPRPSPSHRRSGSAATSPAAGR